MSAWAQLCRQGELEEDPRDAGAWPLPSASSEATIGNESDSCRLMRRPRPPCVKEAAAAVIVPRADSAAASRSSSMLTHAWHLLAGRVALRFVCLFVFSMYSFELKYNNIQEGTQT